MPSTLTDELTTQINRVGNVDNNPLANFSYKLAAYQADTPEAAAGHTDYDPARDNNIPTNTASALDTNATVLSEGFRSQASSITRNLMNHFFGRTSFNLNKVVNVVRTALTSIKNFLGQPNGVATLDAQGRVPYSQLPESAMEFKGFWAANTNTPHIEDGVGTNGDMYVVSVAGTQDLGSGPISFLVNDRVIYSGDTHTWGRIPAGSVTSVNNIQPVDGNVTLPVFTGATSSEAGAQGLVPAPAQGDQDKFLGADGTWRTAAAAAITAVYPIGSLYWTSKAPDNGGNPNTLFPGTTWERLMGAFIWAADDNDTVTPAVAGSAKIADAGSSTALIETNNLPQHAHGMTHYHNKGTMRITGHILSIGYALGSNISSDTTSSGALQGSEFNKKTAGGSSTNATYMSKISIDTDNANSWVGRTSNGYTAQSGGSVKTETDNNTTTHEALDIKNPYINRYCWERVS